MPGTGSVGGYYSIIGGMVTGPGECCFLRVIHSFRASGLQMGLDRLQIRIRGSGIEQEVETSILANRLWEIEE